jgi:hypothetical protein
MRLLRNDVLIGIMLWHLHPERLEIDEATKTEELDRPSCVLRLASFE